MSDRELDGLGPLRSWHRFRALWSDIAEVLGRGYSLVDVHAAVVAEGLWDGSYEVFRRHVSRARREGLATRVAPPAAERVEDRSRATVPSATVPARPAADIHELWSRVMNPNAAKGPYVYGANDDE